MKASLSALAQTRKFPVILEDLMFLFEAGILSPSGACHFQAFALPASPYSTGCMLIDALFGLLVEEVHEGRIGGDMDDLARPRPDPLAEHAGELLAAGFRHHLRLRPGRFHDH